MPSSYRKADQRKHKPLQRRMEMKQDRDKEMKRAADRETGCWHLLSGSLPNLVISLGLDFWLQGAENLTRSGLVA